VELLGTDAVVRLIIVDLKSAVV